MNQRKGTSPWVYVGVGCGCLVLLVAMVVGGLTIFGYRAVKDWEAGIKDPEKRAMKAQEILGYERPPEGYLPWFGISIPWVIEIAALTDQEPDEEGEIRGPIERAFFFVRLSSLVAKDRELRDVLEGRADPSELFEDVDTDIRIDAGETIGEGITTVNGQEVRYVSQRGSLFVERHRVRGILALVFVNCPEGERPGVGGWLAPDPSPDQPVETADFSGTPADPATLSDFLSQFTLCGG